VASWFFSNIRNPLSRTVSDYYKKKNDKHGCYEKGYFPGGEKVMPINKKKYLFIKENNATFQQFFSHFFTKEYRFPRMENTYTNCDYLINVDELQVGFDEVMQRVNLPTSVVPNINPSVGISERTMPMISELTMPLWTGNLGYQSLYGKSKQ
jgi:hypothetical protein